MSAISIKEFYQDIFPGNCPILEGYLEDFNNQYIGHFNVFNTEEICTGSSGKNIMPYNRRTYYKISAIHGNNIVEYADKTIEIKDYAILFATPRIPYRYFPQDKHQKGHFCVFTKEYLAKSESGISIDELPIFKPNGDFIYQISKEQYDEAIAIFNKMHKEIASDYKYKYDLLRNYVIELIHFGQKLTPISSTINSQNASTRISTLFIELLERQFPVETANQGLQVKSAIDFAQSLGVHVNHLNKVLKEVTGKTTTEIIKNRMAQEAKMLLKQTSWSISEIAYSLGFEEVAHFSNFFKKQVKISPIAYRQ